MADKLHITPTPNGVAIGETLTITIDSTGKFKNATEAIIKVFDKKQPGSPMVEFKGTITDNVFTQSEDPKVQNVSGSPDKIKVEIEGSGQDAIGVPLKKKGVFEAGVSIQTKSANGKFNSPKIIFIRAFVTGKRPVVAFITGSESDAFFKHAERFWRSPGKADLVIDKKGISLQDILANLDHFGDRFGLWGQVNIIAHGFPNQIQIKILPSSVFPLHEDKVSEEVDQAIADGTWPNITSVDSDTEVLFRSCNAGQDQDLVDAIKTNIFPSAKFLKIPKFLQFYRTGPGVAEEFFQEELLYDRPTKAEAEADEATQLPIEFDKLKLVSPGLDPKAKAADEVPSFSEQKFTKGEFTQNQTVPESKVKDLSTGKDFTDAELIKTYRDDWSPVHNHDTKSATDKTPHDRWHIELKKSKEKPPKNETKASRLAREQRKGIWFESADATPRIHHLNSGGVVLGSNVNGGGAMTINGDKIGGFHASILINQTDSNGDVDFNRVEVEFKAIGEPDVANIKVGGSTLNEDSPKKVFKLPITVKIGSVSLTVRRGETFVLSFEATRSFKHARRDMKKFIPGSDYKDRPDDVLPDPNDDKHFATST